VKPKDSTATPRFGPSPRRNTTFKGDVLRLVSGTGLAQIIGILAAPILTRLYAPEAVWTAVEAEAPGYGGQSIVTKATATGLSRTTLHRWALEQGSETGRWAFAFRHSPCLKERA
jgi:hypothetical protein